MVCRTIMQDFLSTVTRQSQRLLQHGLHHPMGILIIELPISYILVLLSCLEENTSLIDFIVHLLRK